MSSPGSILWIVRRLPPASDGVGDYTWWLAGTLARKGCGTLILTSSDQDPQNGAVPVLPVVDRWSTGEGHKVAAICRERNVRVVCLQFSPFMYGRRGVCLFLVWWLWCIRFLARTRVVVTFHELYNPWSLNPLRAIMSLLHRLQFFAIGSMADELVFTTQRRAESGKRWFFWKRDRVHTFPVGSNIPPIAERAAALPIPKRGLSGKRYRIGTFGMLQRAVAYEKLLGAFARLVHEDQLDAEILILGDWSKAEPVRKRKLDELVRTLKLQEFVRWAGPQAPDELSRLLSTSDLYVLYREDGPTARSGTLAAALTHGLPVLANRSPQMDPVFENGPVMLFEDATDLRWKCRQVLADTNLRAQLGRAARDFHHSSLTWERIAERYEGLWRQQPQPEGEVMCDARPCALVRGE